MTSPDIGERWPLISHISKGRVFGEGWAIRNIKLRMSRKLLYVSGLLACFSFNLGFDERLGPLACQGSPGPQECIEHLRSLLRYTPLEILATTLMRYKHLEPTARKLLKAYDTFLGMLCDKEIREHLNRLRPEEDQSDMVFQHARNLSRDFTDGLIELFFDSESKMAELTQRYGVFLMRLIGFSSGALAYADFRRGVSMLRNRDIHALELSALRQNELLPLVESLDGLDLNQFTHIAVHAPSQIDASSEENIVALLTRISHRRWPIILHPDAVHDWSLWKNFGGLLCIENMDKRKPVGRTAEELEEIFQRVSDASFCFDIGHARTVGQHDDRSIPHVKGVRQSTSSGPPQRGQYSKQARSTLLWIDPGVQGSCPFNPGISSSNS